MNFGTVPQNVNMMQQQPMMMTMGYGQMPNTLPLQQQTMSMPQTTPAMGFGIPQQFMPGMNMTSFGVMTVDSAPNVNMPSNPMPSTQPPPPPGPPPGPPPNEEQNKITMLQNQAKIWQEQKRLAEQQELQKKKQEEEFLKKAASECPDVSQCMTEEQQFQEQYTTWKKQFDDWKEQNKDHPDKEQYKQYEQQWKTYEYEMDAQKNELARRLRESIDRYKQYGPSHPQALAANQQWNSQAAPRSSTAQDPQDMDWEQPASDNWGQRNLEQPPANQLPDQPSSQGQRWAHSNQNQPHKSSWSNRPPAQVGYQQSGQSYRATRPPGPPGSQPTHRLRNPQQQPRSLMDVDVIRPTGNFRQHQPGNQLHQSARVNRPLQPGEQIRHPVRGPPPHHTDQPTHSHTPQQTGHPHYGPRPPNTNQSFRGPRPPNTGQLIRGDSLRQTSHPVWGFKPQDTRQPFQGVRPQDTRQPVRAVRPQNAGQPVRGVRPQDAGQLVRGPRPSVVGQSAQGYSPQHTNQGLQNDWSLYTSFEKPNPRHAEPRSNSNSSSRPIRPQHGFQGPRGASPRGSGPPPGVAKATKGTPNANLESATGQTSWPAYNPANRTTSDEPHSGITGPLPSDGLNLENPIDGGGDKYDEQKRLIEELMGSSTGMSDVKKADTNLIPEHKMKKPVLTEMTPDVIRKGTLSMVLSALQSQPKTESGKKPATTESQASADQTTTGSSGGDAKEKIETSDVTEHTTPGNSSSVATSTMSAPTTSSVANSHQQNPSASVPPSGQRPSAPGQRPSAPGQRPSAPGQRPSAPGQRPSAPGQRPSAPGQRHLAPGQRHLAPGQRHLAPGQRLSAPGQRHLAPGQRPLAPGQRPYAPGQRHLAPGQRPIAPRQRFLAPGQQHMALDQRHMALGQRPLRPGHRFPEPRNRFPEPGHRFSRPGQRPFAPDPRELDAHLPDADQVPAAVAEVAKALSGRQHDLIKQATMNLQRTGNLPPSLVPDDAEGYDEWGDQDEQYYEDEDYQPDPRRRNLLTMEDGYEPRERHPRLPPRHHFLDDPYDAFEDHYDDPYDRYEAYRPEARYRRPRPPLYEDPYYEDDYYLRRRGRGLLMPEPYSPRLPEDPYDDPLRRRAAPIDPYERHELAREAYNRERYAQESLDREPLMRGPLRDPYEDEAAPRRLLGDSLISRANPEIIDYSHNPSRVSSVLGEVNKGRQLPRSFRRASPPPGFRERSPIRLNDSSSQLPQARPPVAELFDAYSSVTVPEVTDIKDLICKPKRNSRPAHICLIVRGPPGAGKTYCSKLIRDKEAANGGSAPRILNLDDYFMVEVERLVTDPDTGRKMKRKMLEYEYEAEMENSYRADFFKSFKKTVEKGYFSFIIVDAVNEKVSHFEEFAKFARSASFQVYVVDIISDAQTCFARNTHNRTLKDIQNIIDNWEETPSYFHKVDMRGLLQDNAIDDIEMEDSQGKDESSETDSDDEVLAQAAKKSKWEADADDMKLDKLDGLLHKKADGAKNMEDFLSLPDDYESKARGEDGKKHVRWADLEEKRLQDRDRQLGFVVGHTNWNRIVDDDYANKQMNQTKFF